MRKKKLAKNPPVNKDEVGDGKADDEKKVEATAAPEVDDSNIQKFHQYNKLPRELQMMVWDRYRETNAPIHHYMILSSRGRCYAAYDSWTTQFVTKTDKTVDPTFMDGTPLDPYERRIRIINRAMRIDSHADLYLLANCACNPLGGMPVTYEHPVAPFFTWVNFKRDIFFLGSQGRPGHLRFLFNCTRKMPKPLRSNHWAHQIRQLAMYVSEKSLCKLDRETLPRLMGLRKVFLVAQGVRNAFVEPWHNTPAFGGFMKLADYLTHLQGTISSVRVTRYKADANALHTEVLAVFHKRSRRNVTVDLMVDATPHPISRH